MTRSASQIKHSNTFEHYVLETQNSMSNVWRIIGEIMLVGDFKKSLKIHYIKQ